MNTPSPTPDPTNIPFTPEGLKTFGIWVAVVLACLLFAAATNKRGND